MRLQLDGISKAFGGKPVLDGVTADFGEARAVVFIGPSGGGKSTLLRIIAGLEAPDAGTVSLDGERVNFSSEEKLRAHRLKLGVVFQAYNLFPHLTALENVTLPLEKVHGQTPDFPRCVGFASLNTPAKSRGNSAAARNSGWRLRALSPSSRECCSSMSRRRRSIRR